MRYRIKIAEAYGGYLGYLVQRREWLLWWNVNGIVHKEYDEALKQLGEIAAKKSRAVEVGTKGHVVYQVEL